MDEEKKLIKITHIIPSLNFGGAERFVVDLINNCDSNFRFSIITFSENNPLAKQITRLGVEIKIIKKRGKFSWHLFADLAVALQELKPDIVHTHLFGADVWGRVVAHRLNLPVITTEHNLNFSEGKLKILIKKYLRNYSNVYTCPSVAVANFMQQYYKIKQEIKIIPHGVDAKKLLTIAPITSSEPYKILMLGRLHKQKGQEFALRALVQLLNYNWQLQIVGSGEEKNNLEKLIKKLNLSDRVSMIPANDQVVEHLSNNQIFLMPSLWEGFGLSAVEALLAGRIVVASAVDGLKEIITDQINGYLCQSGNVESIKNSLQKVFTDFSSAMLMAQQGQRIAKEKFSLEKMVKEYEVIYQQSVF